MVARQSKQTSPTIMSTYPSAVLGDMMPLSEEGGKENKIKN
jgi:hypothetical protein